MGMNFKKLKVEDLTKEQLLQIFALRAEMQMHCNDLMSGLFVNGTFCEKEIHLASSCFHIVTEKLQPVVTYNPVWSKDMGEMYFYLDILGTKFKVFSLWKLREEE